MSTDQVLATDTPPPDVPPADAGTPPVATPADDASQSFLARVKETTGQDLSEKYANDEEAMKGLIEAHKLVGQRSESARNWDQLTEHLAGREEAFRDFLEDKPVTPPVAAAPGDNGQNLPETYEEYLLLQSQVYDETGGVRKNADPAMVAKERAASQLLQKRMYEQAANQKKALEPFAEELTQRVLQQATQATQQLTVAQQANADLAAVEQKHAELLFPGGDVTQGFTAQGDKVRTYLQKLEAAGMPRSAEALEIAVAHVLAEQPRPKGTRTAPQRGASQPAVGQTAAGSPDQRALIRGDPDKGIRGLKLGELIFPGAKEEED